MRRRLIGRDLCERRDRSRPCSCEQVSLEGQMRRRRRGERRTLLLLLFKEVRGPMGGEFGPTTKRHLLVRRSRGQDLLCFIHSPMMTEC